MWPSILFSVCSAFVSSYLEEKKKEKKKPTNSFSCTEHQITFRHQGIQSLTSEMVQSSLLKAFETGRAGEEPQKFLIIAWFCTDTWLFSASEVIHGESLKDWQLDGEWDMSRATALQREVAASLSIEVSWTVTSGGGWHHCQRLRWEGHRHAITWKG